MTPILKKMLASITFLAACFDPPADTLITLYDYKVKEEILSRLPVTDSAEAGPGIHSVLVNMLVVEQFHAPP